ncbi:hypothetical protein DFQ27_004207 [Actinomortierella ambigua]|uniref:sphingomyelin phosphodiesterase n=1 Tax=Actinomortierella ambigua TaxID=1343610 RepID=A0A9P6Q2H5_9FUNG|nr:hypothetical protein DFQ27_004207 [Actinomortierella ambigua]
MLAGKITDDHGAKSNQRTLSIVSHNLFMVSKKLANWEQETRARLIVEADYIKNRDIVVLQEVFDPHARQILKAGLLHQYPYQTDVVGQTKGTQTAKWDSTTGAFASWALENGGTMVLSKWPILEQRQHIFSNACGVETAFNFGFVYAKIDYPGGPLHVLGTHLQPQDPYCFLVAPETVRRSQLQEIHAFMAHQLQSDGVSLLSNDTVIYAGDMNIIRSSAAEYASMLLALEAVPPDEYVGLNATWHPLENALAGYYWPNGGPEFLDYVLLHNQYRRRVMRSRLEALMAKSGQEYMVASGDRYHELSDHYPVLMSIELLV